MKSNRLALVRAFPLTIQHENTSAFSSLSMPNILGDLPDVAPVIEDAMEEDIMGDNVYGDQVVNRRIMSPSAASYSSIEVDANPFDQDYDQYSLHMSTFQAYNTTHEELPTELGLLEPDDVMNLEVVESYWENHENAFDDELPPVHSMDGEEFAPDVEDI